MRLICKLFLVSLFACNRDNAILPGVNSSILDIQNQPNWKTERLNDNYTIQFPSSYKGGIAPTIEGPEFSLQKNDQQVYFLAPLPFFIGITPLSTPQPDSISYTNLVLNRTVIFRRNGQTQGLLYYAKQPKAQGQLFLLQNGQLIFTMIIQYNFDLHQEVLGILQTIQPH